MAPNTCQIELKKKKKKETDESKVEIWYGNLNTLLSLSHFLPILPQLISNKIIKQWTKTLEHDSIINDEHNQALRINHQELDKQKKREIGGSKFKPKKYRFGLNLNN